jgi:HEPN domain-containing protein
MTKEEHVKWWLDESERNWKTAIFNRDGKQNVFSLFAFHLCVEKLLKALWIKENVDNFPPRTHDLKKLYNDTDLNLDNNWYDFLVIINEWNIEGRYPDYKLKVYARATDEYVHENSLKIEKLTTLIKQNLI